MPIDQLFRLLRRRSRCAKQIIAPEDCGLFTTSMRLSINLELERFRILNHRREIACTSSALELDLPETENATDKRLTQPGGFNLSEAIVDTVRVKRPT